MVLADEGYLRFDAGRDPGVIRSVVEAVDRLTVSVLLRLVGLEAVENEVACEKEFGSISPEVSRKEKAKEN